MGAQSDPAREVFYGRDTGELIGTDQFSLDPLAGGSYNGKPIWDVPTIEANLNRTGWDWYTNNYGVLQDGVLNFGFWNSIDELANSYYSNDTGTVSFSEVDPNTFSPFTAEQRVAARNTIALWDDLISVSFQETRSGLADITYANTSAQAGVQAYAYLPFGDIFDDYYVSSGWEEGQVGRLGGDVWIGGNVASNFFPLEDSYYSVLTQIHETGHALGLSHPGDYDAGDGVPITYDNSASYAQDTLQYTVMSYWDAYETGAQHIDWSLLNFSYAATPLVHDIAAIQAIYGADTTTRTGDTVYGFNSTADRSAYDFSQNTRPVVAIYDAGGVDTLDFSGWDTPSVLDLNPGAFSSGGGSEEFLTLEQVNANRAALGFAPRTQATFDFYEQLKQQLGLTNGLFKDNISIAYNTIIENAVGGAGNDLIIANAVANVLDGREGNDTVSYAPSTSGVTVDLATGGVAGYADGDSYIGIENVIGSAFGDRITGDDGDNIIEGGAGADVLDGGAGIDTLSYAGSTAGVTVRLETSYVTGGDAARDTVRNFENVTGSAFRDTITGNAADNVIDGGDGNDLLNGANGNDTVSGGLGDDALRGGNGEDQLSGGDGDDSLFGENGSDLLLGGAGDDVLNGANGSDTLNGGEGDDALSGGGGSDLFVFDTVAGIDSVTDFRSGLDKIDVSDVAAFTFIGGASFSGANQLRYFVDEGVKTLAGDIDGDGVADFVLHLTGTSTAVAAADLILV